MRAPISDPTFCFGFSLANYFFKKPVREERGERERERAKNRQKASRRAECLDKIESQVGANFAELCFDILKLLDIFISKTEYASSDCAVSNCCPAKLLISYHNNLLSFSNTRIWVPHILDKIVNFACLKVKLH